jgi:N utilization substance protein B
MLASLKAGPVSMALPPQKFREIVVQLLYSQEFATLEPQEIVPFIMHELKVTRRSVAAAYEKVLEILGRIGEIDEAIRVSSTAYSFERISRVEKTILRLGVFELLFDPALPPKVAIAEAIRLCRKFGTPESSEFVNAIMDDVYQNRTQKLVLDRAEY